MRLASDEGLRLELGDNLRRYLDTVVSWDVVTGQYEKVFPTDIYPVHLLKAILIEEK